LFVFVRFTFHFSLFTAFMAKALMIQGTGSGAGKSLIAAAFCRIFRDMGLKVAPFKAQNMALNSYITVEGGEIGRAQALQAEAAGAEPSVDMNPVLLKASGEIGSQVVIQGRVHSTMKARQYYAFRKEAWEAVRTSYARLSRKYDVIVLEGAGSPAEINLMDVDIVNMAMARHAKAPVLLVGDIDKGGVFASLYGTIKLLGRDKRYIKAFVINKFRGDAGILRPGLDMIREKTGVPVAGVLPYIHDLGLPEEDGMALYNKSYVGAYGNTPMQKTLRIVVVRLQYISNFTDFDPFYHEPDVEIIYSAHPSDIENADLVVIPGTKNTVRDLLFLRERGLDASVKNACRKGIMIMGMCGGYQMLGGKIFDPYGVESGHPEIEGIGLLDIETTFGKEKRTCRVEAEIAGPGEGRSGIDRKKTGSDSILKGYEIHMGESTGDIGLFRLKRLGPDPEHGTRDPGAVFDGSQKGNCWGTYLHGIFDNDHFRRDLLNELRARKGLAPLESSCSYADIRDKAIDRLADVVRTNVDMDFIKGMLGL
jgi:adenosylcobyric acid synthase